jgi:hypothetical protein
MHRLCRCVSVCGGVWRRSVCCDAVVAAAGAPVFSSHLRVCFIR